MEKLLFSFCLAVALLACESEKMEKVNRPTGNELKIQWELVSNMVNGEDRFEANLAIINGSSELLPALGWTIYFNQWMGVIDPQTINADVDIQKITGDFYRLKPKPGFEALSAGDTIRIKMGGDFWVIKESGAPGGFYIVFENEDGTEQAPENITNLEIAPFTREEQMLRTTADQIPPWTPAWQYAQNASVSLLPMDRLSSIVPTPQSVEPGNGEMNLTTAYVIRYQEALKKEATFLRDRLQQVLGTTLSIESGSQGGENVILLALDESFTGNISKTQGDEAYQLSISKEGGIKISAMDQAGAFYGIQTLLGVIPPETLSKPQTSIAIPEGMITDFPRYGYRGLHLDVSRNFHKKESILKLLDVMATYKLNKFHFHLTDDEGWRLEIPEIPELTDIGAFRGHTLTEEDRLIPSYGSGPFADPDNSYGSGYYSKADFIEILQYAHERHIEVIPEFDFPGHARAAIKAMEARYKKYMAAGDEVNAVRFLLHDPNDKSEYRSVQFFPDNVICVCQESVYQFLEQVVQSTVNMYKEAGVPLKTIHTGGDEVPAGVWKKSPVCDNLMAQREDFSSTSDLSAYFLRRFSEILEAHNLVTAGWEEIALKKTESGYVVNEDLLDRKLQPYVWNNLWGFQDLSNRLANAGYPVVLCNVTNLYFDLSYNKDPKEPGYHWGGFVDTRKAFEFTPSDVFKSIKADNMGRPFDIDTFYKEMENLTEEGRKNIIGIQGQLWSEVIKGRVRLESATLPKLLGLAERAWAPIQAWEETTDQNTREKALDEAWNIFANKVGQFQLPRLDNLSGGYDYRIPTPGVLIREGELLVNNTYPGLEIRYTTDGSDPDLSAPLYKEPIKVEGNVKLKTFNSTGRSSRTIEP